MWLASFTWHVCKIHHSAYMFPDCVMFHCEHSLKWVYRLPHLWACESFPFGTVWTGLLWIFSYMSWRCTDVCFLMGFVHILPCEKSLNYFLIRGCANLHSHSYMFHFLHIFNNQWDCLFYFSHSSEYVVPSHGGLNLHFPVD